MTLPERAHQVEVDRAKRQDDRPHFRIPEAKRVAGHRMRENSPRHARSIPRTAKGLRRICVLTDETESAGRPGAPGAEALLPTRPERPSLRHRPANISTKAAVINTANARPAAKKPL